MATELQPPDALISTAPQPITAAVSPEPPLLDHPTTTTAAATNPPKRQRRPSVRLGEIGGDPPYDPHHRRPSKTWRFHKDPSLAAKTSKTRPLTNLVNGAGEPNFQDSVEISDNYVDFSHRKSKIKKPTKRARTNWNTNKLDSTAVHGGGAGIIESTNFLQEENENNNVEFRDFEAEGSESLKEQQIQSPVNSVENMGLQFWDQHRRGNNRARVSESNPVEVNSSQNEGSVGVRDWLIGLGLGKYAPVFEIHEVDDEVLPMLTLEDLKDMGVNAVGSRRKMYSAILKLQKGFS